MLILVRQTSIEVRLWLRRRETVLFSIALPVLFLVFFGALYGKDHVPGNRSVTYIDYIVPAYAVYAIMAVALGTISANVANERFFGILKRLGGTPMPKWCLIGAKILAAALLAGAVILGLVIVGIFVYHVQLRGNQIIAVLVLAAGVLCFSALGITLGGIIKADAAVAAGALIYLALSFLGGVFVPRYQFGGALRQLSQYLPSERMVHALQSVWTGGQGIGAVGQDILVMAIWAAAALLISIRFFRWE